MIILNFSHPLTPAHLEQIEAMTGQKVERVVEVKARLDHEQPFAPEAKALVDSVGLSGEEWQTLPLLVNLPSLNTIAAAVLAELHGRMGYFPSILRLKPVPNSNPPQFEVAEIVNLNQIRESVRYKR